MRRYIWLVATALVLQHAAQCADPERLLAKAPQKAQRMSNPFAADAAETAAGRKLFRHHCAECHGADARGTKRAPALDTDTIHRAFPGSLFWIITNGVIRHGMPDWSKLPEPQRWQIVTYLQALAGGSSP